MGAERVEDAASFLQELFRQAADRLSFDAWSLLSERYIDSDLQIHIHLIRIVDGERADDCLIVKSSGRVNIGPRRPDSLNSAAGMKGGDGAEADHAERQVPVFIYTDEPVVSQFDAPLPAGPLRSEARRAHRLPGWESIVRQGGRQLGLPWS